MVAGVVVITLDLSFYWMVVSVVLLMYAGAWGFRRVKGLLGRN